MTQEKLATFVSRLHKATMKGQVVWKASNLDDCFQTSLAGYTVQIGLYREEWHAMQICYVLRILNIVRDLIDESTDATLRPYLDDAPLMMRALYNEARRQVRDYDAALDSILAQLSTMDSK